MSQSTKKLYKNKWYYSDLPDLTGQVIVVTGANRGLGFVAAKEIARKGAQVIIPVRNVEAGENAKKEIQSEDSNAKIDVMKVDLGNLESINTFGKEFKQKYTKLNALLNNGGITAGIKLPAHETTSDGFEYFFGVNHLGTYALTGVLFDVLKQTPDSRVVTVSSLSHKQASMHFDDLMSEKKYSTMGVYAQSKLANLLFGYELSRLIQEKNLSMKSLVVHPGFARSSKKKQGLLIQIGKKLLAQSAEKGALPLVYGVTAPDVENGDYIGPGGFMGVKGYPKRSTSNKKSYNEEDAKKLWQISKELTMIEYNF